LGLGSGERNRPAPLRPFDGAYNLRHFSRSQHASISGICAQFAVTLAEAARDDQALALAALLELGEFENRSPILPLPNR
jgi:hypothetical protein